MFETWMSGSGRGWARRSRPFAGAVLVLAASGVLASCGGGGGSEQQSAAPPDPAEGSTGDPSSGEPESGGGAQPRKLASLEKTLVKSINESLTQPGQPKVKQATCPEGASPTAASTFTCELSGKGQKGTVALTFIREDQITYTGDFGVKTEPGLAAADQDSGFSGNVSLLTRE